MEQRGESPKVTHGGENKSRLNNIAPSRVKIRQGEMVHERVRVLRAVSQQHLRAAVDDQMAGKHKEWFSNTKLI